MSANPSRVYRTACFQHFFADPLSLHSIVPEHGKPRDLHWTPSNSYSSTDDTESHITLSSIILPSATPTRKSCPTIKRPRAPCGKHPCKLNKAFCVLLLCTREMSSPNSKSIPSCSERSKMALELPISVRMSEALFFATQEVYCCKNAQYSGYFALNRHQNVVIVRLSRFIDKVDSPFTVFKWTIT